MTAKENNEKLREISSENLIFSASNLRVKREALRLLEKVRKNTPFESNDYKLIDLIKNCEEPSTEKLSVINSLDQFESIIDEDFTTGICNEKESVRNKISEAFDLLGLISVDWKLNMVEVLETVIGVCDEYNVINSGFTNDFPGLISLNINAGRLVIGEQLVHETTHLIFSNKIYFDSEVRQRIRAIPPVYSVFAQKPRSIELVLHGLFSYTSVFLYWDRLEMILPEEILSSKNRKKQVLPYIQNALQNLNNVLTESDWNYISNLYKEFCPFFKAHLWKIRSKKVEFLSSDIIEEIRNCLNDIECAELILAFEGNKVSRISRPVNQIWDIVNLVNKIGIFYCFSDYVFTSREDEKINKFHNVIYNSYNIKDLDSYSDLELNIHIYFSSSQGNLLKAFHLDKSDDCAPLFKTPQCCETHFKKYWQYALDHFDGDMTKIYFEGITKEIKVSNLKYNPIAMYFGLGFCWHFPCSLDCTITKQVIDDRIEVLRKYPDILDRLNRIDSYNLIVDVDLNYHLMNESS